MLARLKLSDGWTALVILAVCSATALAATRGEVRPANALGPTNAPVTIEFFSDLQCPQCARYEPTIKTYKLNSATKCGWSCAIFR
jgi:protein-disulfide isomerase